VFVDKYSAKYPKAVDCLTKDREALLSFFDFPAEHWDHLRTSNPIESVFATVRHRTVRAKGALSHKTARLMVFKLVMSAAKPGVVSKAKISCQWSSPASNSPTASHSL
jgi:putative transposase